MIDPQLAQLLMAAAQQQQQQRPPPTAQQPWQMVPNPNGGMDLTYPGSRPPFQQGGQPRPPDAWDPFSGLQHFGNRLKDVMGIPPPPPPAPPAPPQAVPQQGQNARQVIPAAPVPAAPLPADQFMNRWNAGAGVPGGGVGINHGWDPAAPPGVPAGLPAPPPKPGFGQQMTNPQAPPPPSGIAAPATTGAIPPAPPVAPPGTATGGWRVGLGNAMAGMAGVDTTSSGLSAFAQGFSGAQGKQAEREEAKRAEQKLSDAGLAAAEQRDYERGRDTITDERANAKDLMATGERDYQRGRDTVADKRADDEAVIKEKVAKRDEREAQLEEISTAAGIQKTRAEIRKIDREYTNSGMTIDQSLDLEQRVNAYGQIISKGVFTNSEKINDMMDVYRADLIKRVLAGQPLPDPATESGGTTEVPQSGFTGQGSYESPLDFSGMADPRGFLASVPTGTHYINPLDGKLYRTKDTGRT